MYVVTSCQKLGIILLISDLKIDLKSVNLKHITVGRMDDDMIVTPSDGPMFILIDWELFSETVVW